MAFLAQSIASWNVAEQWRHLNMRLYLYGICMAVTTISTSGQHLKDDGEETDPIRLYFQSSISQQCAYVCSRSTSSLSPPMCRHPCYRLLRCRAVITKNMSRKKHSSFLTGTTEWYYWSFLPSHSSRCSSFCSVIARPVLRKHLRLFP